MGWAASPRRSPPSGTVTATQLYGPYGGVRYQNGSLPGTRAYTGQRADAVTGASLYRRASSSFAGALPRSSPAVTHAIDSDQTPRYHSSARWARPSAA